MPHPEHQNDEGRIEANYHHAARFASEQSAGEAYSLAQEEIFSALDCDLSSFRLVISHVWHVVVVGQMPEAELDQRLGVILAAGEPALLTDDVLELLSERRARMIKRGPWIERHYGRRRDFR